MHHHRSMTMGECNWWSASTWGSSGFKASYTLPFNDVDISRSIRKVIVWSSRLGWQPDTNISARQSVLLRLTSSPLGPCCPSGVIPSISPISSTLEQPVFRGAKMNQSAHLSTSNCVTKDIVGETSEWSRFLNPDCTSSKGTIFRLHNVALLAADSPETRSRTVGIASTGQCCTRHRR